MVQAEFLFHLHVLFSFFDLHTNDQLGRKLEIIFGKLLIELDLCNVHDDEHFESSPGV